MQIRESLLPYLFILCALCSVIAQDASSQDSAYDPDALNYLSYLNKHHLEGSWQSASTTQPFGTFEEHSGFFVSQKMNDCAMPFAVSFSVYDGRYVDGGSIEVSLCHKFSPSFHFNSTNSSFIGTNVLLEVSGNGFTDKSCLSDVSIYFFESVSDASKIDIQFVISSFECAFSITTDKLALIQNYYVPETFYILVCIVLLVFESICLCRIISHAENSRTGTLLKISSESSSWLMSCSLLMLIINLVYLFSKRFSWSTIPTLMSICQILIMKRGYEVIELNEDPRGVRLFCVIPIIWGIVRYFFSKTWPYFLSCLYLVPQIIENYKSKEEYKLRDFSLLLMFLPSQLFDIGYFWMNSDSFSRLKPNPTFVFAYFGFTAVQVIILVSQSRQRRSRYQIQNNEMAHVESEHDSESQEA